MSQEKTNKARQRRTVFNAQTNVRLEGKNLDVLRQVANLLHVDVSDLLRAMVCGIVAIAEKSPLLKENHSPTTSYKIRYV